MANDLAYVVQAVVCDAKCFHLTEDSLTTKQAPNFVWKTTDFPAAKDGYLWSIILQMLSSKLYYIRMNCETN